MATNMPDDDIDMSEAREIAFVSYFNALLGHDESPLSPPDGSSQGSESGDQSSAQGARDGGVIHDFEELRDGRLIAEAIYTIDPQNFQAPSSASSSDPLCLFRRIYHSILTSPSCLPLTYLPAPDLALITETVLTSSSSLSASTRLRQRPPRDSDAWKQPLLELCQLALVSQAVYGRSNALVVGKIRNGIALQEQKVLKEIIEDVLIYVAEEGGAAEEEEDVDPEVDEAAPITDGDDIDLMSDQFETATVTETQTDMSCGTSTSDPLEMELVNARRARAGRIRQKALDREAKRFYDLQVKRRVDGQEREALRSEVGRMREEMEKVRGELDETKTLLGRQLDQSTSLHNGGQDSSEPTSKYGRTSTGAQQAMDKIREMEMDRMRIDLNKRDEELRHQEGLLEENTRLMAVALQRNAELQAQLDRMASLKDELEIHKHSTEKLRKSENVIEKLKKKLDETADTRREFRNLEDQIDRLRQADATWAVKYHQLLEQSSGPGPATQSSKKPDLDLRNAQADLARSQADWHEVHVELEAAKQRIAELEAEAYFGDGVADEAVTMPMSEVQLRERVAHLEAILETIGDPPPTIDMSEEQKLRALGRHEKAILLTEQLKASEAKLAKARTLLRQQEDRLAEKHPEPATSPSAAFAEAEAIYQQQISDLGRELEASRQKLETVQRGFRQEKFLALKAWDDLSQRTLRTQEAGQTAPISWLEQQRVNALASPRLRKSKA